MLRQSEQGCSVACSCPDVESSACLCKLSNLPCFASIPFCCEVKPQRMLKTRLPTCGVLFRGRVQKGLVSNA